MTESGHRRIPEMLEAVAAEKAAKERAARRKAEPFDAEKAEAEAHDVLPAGPRNPSGDYRAPRPSGFGFFAYHYKRGPKLKWYRSFGKFRFRIVGGNGEKVASGQGYKEFRSMVETLDTFVKPEIMDAAFDPEWLSQFRKE